MRPRVHGLELKIQAEMSRRTPAQGPNLANLLSREPLESFDAVVYGSRGCKHPPHGAAITCECVVIWEFSENQGAPGSWKDEGIR